MRNKYPGKCFVCGKEVPAGAGHFQGVGSLPKEDRKKYFGKWLIRCRRCVGNGNQPIKTL
jgi:hypothetical protein